MTFLEKHPEFHVLLHELVRLRNQNKQTVLAVEQLLFAEGALVLLAMERLLRILLGAEATERDTLPNLLEKAFSSSRRLLRPPGDGDVSRVVREIRTSATRSSTRTTNKPRSKLAA
jgi:hypothetical protein